MYGLTGFLNGAYCWQGQSMIHLPISRSPYLLCPGSVDLRSGQSVRSTRSGLFISSMALCSSGRADSTEIGRFQEIGEGNVFANRVRIRAEVPAYSRGVPAASPENSALGPGGK